MVSIANLIAAIAIIFGHTLSCTGFTLGNINNGGYNIGNSGPLCAATDDASAQALSDYMAKSHEEKLKAVRDVEDKKNSQIQVSAYTYINKWPFIVDIPFLPLARLERALKFSCIFAIINYFSSMIMMFYLY